MFNISLCISVRIDEAKLLELKEKKCQSQQSKWLYTSSFKIQYSLIFKHPTRANFLCCCMYVYSGLKISVSDASDKMSGVFGLGSDIFKMMSAGALDLDMVNVAK